MNNLRNLERIQAREEWSRDEVIDLRHYWNVVNRAKWSIISLTGIVSVITLLIVYAMTPIYQASTTILIESSKANVVSIEEIYGLDTGAQQYYETQFAILKSRPLAERVINKLTLTSNSEFEPEKKTWLLDFNLRDVIPFNLSGTNDDTGAATPDFHVAATKRYMENLRVEPVRNTQLVNVNYLAKSPSLAAAVANAHAHAYIESIMDARVDMNQSASSWLNRRLGDLKLVLEESETKLQDYREQEKIVDLKEGLQSLPAKEINELSSRLIEVQRDLSQAKTAYLQVRQLGEASIKELSAVPAVLTDALVQRLRQDSAAAESRVAELAERYGPKHPKMIAAQSELVAANESLVRHMGSVTEAIKTKYEDALDQENALNEALSNAKQQYQSLGRKESEFRALQQAAQSNRALYEMFYNRIQETAQTDDLESANARIISPAIAPDKPIKPNKKLILLLTVVVSLMIGLVAAFILDALDNTIKSAQDVEEKLKQSLLGVLPKIQLAERDAFAGLSFFDAKQHGFSEALRTLRTGISLSNLDNPFKTILVTSSVAGEGKSTTSLGLAYAFGQMEKVLLIDADLRRPCIAKELEIPRNHLGLSELVEGSATPRECIIHREKESIDVLVAGMIPTNPLELLSSRKFDSTLKALRERYDRIIIDCAPTLPVSDARFLSTLADSVVYVVKADETSQNLVETGLRHLHHVHAPITGIVLNQLDLRKAEKYSDYGYDGYYESYETQAT